MGMTLLNELRSLALVKRLVGLDSTAVKNAFFANYLAGLLFVKLQDLKGLALVNDRAHSKLSSFSHGMTDTTFWGRALFYPTDPLVKRSLQVGHADLLSVEAGRILDTRVHKIINVLMSNPSSIDWQETVVSLVILKHRFELNSSYFNKLVLSLNKWDSLSTGGRRVAISTAYAYLNQADPKSALLGRVRELAGTSMLDAGRNLLAKLVNFTPMKPLKEDDAGGTSTANIASSDGCDVSSNAIISRFGPDNALAGLLTIKDYADNQVGGNKKAIKLGHVKKARKFKIIKFKMPTREKA